jgi:hypothetical protein
MLPAVVLFKHGVSVDRVVGFDELGGKDDFPTKAFEQRLAAANVVNATRKPARRGSDGGDGGSSDEDDEQRRDGAHGSGAIRRGFVSKVARDDDDESSDFD